VIRFMVALLTFFCDESANDIELKTEALIVMKIT